jgi:hypothetical protein
VFLGGTITEEEAKKLWPQGIKQPKPFIRIGWQRRG